MHRMTDTQLLQDHLRGAHAIERVDGCRACTVSATGPQRVRKNTPRLGTGRPCLCGCGETVSPTARFRPGHDAKLKSRLLKIARDPDHAGQQKAIERLQGLGWAQFI